MDAVAVGAMLTVVGALIVLVVLGVRVSRLIKQDGERNKSS